MSLQKMMQKAQAVRDKLSSLQSEMETREFEGAAGGGAVKITLTGKGHMVRTLLEPSLLNPAEKDLLEDLILAAHRDAKEKADSALSDAMATLTGGLGLPPGMKLPF